MQQYKSYVREFSAGYYCVFVSVMLVLFWSIPIRLMLQVKILLGLAASYTSPCLKMMETRLLLLSFFFFFFFNFVSVLKQLMQRDVDLGKQYEPVAVVCRVWLRKVLLLVLFARPSWKGLIIETNWGRKRTGSIRASSTASFKLVVGLKR